MKHLAVLVPKPDTVAAILIDRGSGIVTDAEDMGSVVRATVYFEGNRYHSSDMATFSQRVFHAAGRLSQHYPTIARAFLPLDEFTVVGTFTYAEDWSTWNLSIHEVETVTTWTDGQWTA